MGTIVSEENYIYKRQGTRCIEKICLSTSLQYFLFHLCSILGKTKNNILINKILINKILINKILVNVGFGDLWMKPYHRKLVELLCLMPHYFSYILAVSFIGWGNRMGPVKITDLSHVTDKLLSQNVVSSTSRLVMIRTHNFIGDRHWLHR